MPGRHDRPVYWSEPPTTPLPRIDPTLVGGPRNLLGSVTFALVLVGAILAVLPATAPAGFFLCLVMIVPAFVAHRRSRLGRASNRGRSLTAVLAAPVFLVWALVVGAATAPPPVAGGAGDVGVLAVGSPAAPATLTAVPGDPSLPTASPPSEAEVVVVLPTRAQAAVSRATVNFRPAPAAPAVAPQTVPAAPLAPPAPLPPPPAPVPVAPPVTVAPPVDPAPPADTCDEATHYVNSDGICVSRPVEASSAPPGATAQCGDGTWSFSLHRQGTCSHHSGVQQWL